MRKNHRNGSFNQGYVHLTKVAKKESKKSKKKKKNKSRNQDVDDLDRDIEMELDQRAKVSDNDNTNPLVLGHSLPPDLQEPRNWLDRGGRTVNPRRRDIIEDALGRKIKGHGLIKYAAPRGRSRSPNDRSYDYDYRDRRYSRRDDRYSRQDIMDAQKKKSDAVNGDSEEKGDFQNVR